MTDTIFTKRELAQMSKDDLRDYIRIASKNVDLLEADHLFTEAHQAEQAHDELVEELKKRPGSSKRD